MRTKSFLVAGFMVATTQMAQAASVDLSDWLAEGTTNFNWVLEADNNAVKQTLNGQPTVFHNNQNSQGNALSGTIQVQTTSDDDFVGFVLGYRAGDLSNPAADYLLIDWKQATQSYAGTGLIGLAISRVTGALGDNSGAWAHNPANNVTELQRATNLGSVGWVDNREYTFDLTFTSSLVEVFVDGTKELSFAGSFADGAFGFYNYSQSNVRYAGIGETALPAVPLPASAALLLAALGGLGVMRRKRQMA